MKTSLEIEEIKNKCSNINHSSMIKIHSLLLTKFKSLTKYPLKEYQYSIEDFILMTSIEDMSDFCCINGLLPLEGNLKRFGIIESTEIKLFMMLIYGSTSEDIEQAFNPKNKRELIILHGISLMYKATIGPYIRIYFRIEVPEYNQYVKPITQEEMDELIGL